MNSNTNPHIVERTLDAPIEAVWNAITDENQMRQWFFEPMEEFRSEVGFATQFNVHHEGRDFIHVWSVTEVEPMKRIAYRWRYEGYPGDSTVIWELSESPDSTTLVLTHLIHEEFPADDPILAWDPCQAGWEFFVLKSLPAFLSGHALPRE